MEIQSENPDGLAANSKKIILEFGSSDAKDFRLFLFSGNQAHNKLEFSATEIDNLSKGDYTLIIQHVNKEENFCAKQFKFKIN